MIGVVLNSAKGEQDKNALLILKSCKSFGLYWKSLVKREKEDFKKKWTELGLKAEELE